MATFAVTEGSPDGTIFLVRATSLTAPRKHAA
jgi:hypothetical protein